MGVRERSRYEGEGKVIYWNREWGGRNNPRQDKERPKRCSAQWWAISARVMFSSLVSYPSHTRKTCHAPLVTCSLLAPSPPLPPSHRFLVLLPTPRLHPTHSPLVSLQAPHDSFHADSVLSVAAMSRVIRSDSAADVDKENTSKAGGTTPKEREEQLKAWREAREGERERSRKRLGMATPGFKAGFRGGAIPGTPNAAGAAGRGGLPPVPVREGMGGIRGGDCGGIVERGGVGGWLLGGGTRRRVRGGGAVGCWSAVPFLGVEAGHL